MGAFKSWQILGKFGEELKEERGRIEEVRGKGKNKVAQVDEGFMYVDL